MNAVYHNKIACQSTFSLKDEIKRSPFRTLDCTYFALKLYASKLTLVAYDLYCELSFLALITKKKIIISASEMMPRLGITRQHAFHAAKNNLLQLSLIKYTDNGYNSCNVYQVVKKPESSDCFYKVPFAIWNWLLRLLLQKIITRIERHVFVWLFHKWTITGYEDNFNYSPSECGVDLFLTKRTYQRAFSKLEKLEILKRTSSNTRNTYCSGELYVEKNLKYTVRKGQIRIEICDDTKNLLNNLKLLQKI